jgi:hypothetical protein
MTDTDTGSATEVPTTLKVGDLIIAMRHGDSTYIYGGEPDNAGFERVTFDMLHGRTMLHASPERVAPAALFATIEKDPRVVATKRTTAEARAAGHYGRGSWSYTIPGNPQTLWANTKTEAIQEGSQRLAIAAWHEREDTSVDLTGTID